MKTAVRRPALKAQSNPSTSNIPQLAYQVPEVAKAVRLSRAKLYLEIKAGRLKIIKCGRRTLITPQAVQAWLASLADQASYV